MGGGGGGGGGGDGRSGDGGIFCHGVAAVVVVAVVVVSAAVVDVAFVVVGVAAAVVAEPMAALRSGTSSMYPPRPPPLSFGFQVTLIFIPVCFIGTQAGTAILTRCVCTCGWPVLTRDGA